MNKRTFFIFIAVYSVLFGLTHHLAFSIASRSIQDSSLVSLVASIFIFGWISMPLGLWGSHQHPPKWKILSWLGYIWLGFFTIVMFFAIIEFFIYLFYSHNYSYWVLYIAFLISIYSLWNALRPPTLVTHTLQTSEKLHGFKLVQISDVHLGLLNLNKAWFTKVLERINKIQPNALAITGDLTEASFLTVQPILESFSKLNPQIHKFYITGNHEYIQPGHWEKELEKYCFTALHNFHRIIHFNQGKLLIAGVPDISAGNFNSGITSLPDQALQSYEPVDYRILLAHQPTSVFHIKKEKCDLMLAGHTHGGQIFPFHLLARLVMPVLKGFKEINNVLVFTHQGTGYWGPPMRWFSRSEIVVFEFNGSSHKL